MAPASMRWWSPIPRVLVFAVLVAALSGGAFAGTWRDDFALGIKDWSIYNLDRAVESWDGKKGEAIGTIFAPNLYSLLILDPSSTDASRWSNYTLRVRVRAVDLKERDGEPRVGVSLYDQEFEGNRYLCLLAFDTGEVWVVRVTRDVWQVIPLAYPLEKGVTYDLTASIATEGDSELVTFAVNKDFEITIRASDPLKSGKVGLVVADAQAAFDDVEVDGTNVPNGGSGKPRAVSPRGAAAVTWGSLKSN